MVATSRSSGRRTEQLWLWVLPEICMGLWTADASSSSFAVSQFAIESHDQNINPFSTPSRHIYFIYIYFISNIYGIAIKASTSQVINPWAAFYSFSGTKPVVAFYHVVHLDDSPLLLALQKKVSTFSKSHHQ